MSKGRTIRQLCYCVLLIPTSVVMLWMGVLGGATAGVDLFYNAGVVEAVNNDYASGVFQTVAGFGYTWSTYPITVLITILLISWFVTSSASGTLVMCAMLSMGDEHPPVKFRIFWGLPIAVILLFMIYGIVKSLHEEHPLPDVEDKYEMEFLNR
ncbi:MAG: choline/glycine/proline betaine transport protein [Paracoccaceae bacterium]|jgi:choline/glycine/proline betaine transport protein